VMPLFRGHQLIGVFYIDQGSSGAAIEAAIYIRFKELVMRLAPQD